jgi:tetratricopeptide (TPR) repeat protein
MEGRGDSKSTLANAERLYRQALSQAPDNPVIAAQLAALLTRMDGQFPAPDRRREIRHLIEWAVERAPNHPMPWVAQAKLFLLEGKYQEAEQAAREAIERGPEFDRGYTILGEALIDQGHLEEGLDQIRKGVAVGEGPVRARLVLATRLQDASRYEEAAAELQKVLALDPDHPTANNNLGNIYLRSGRSQDAIPLFRKAFEVTRDARMANNLGFAYFDLDRMDEAIQAFKDAHQLDPSLYTPPINLGESYEKVGNGEEARRWYAVALKTYDNALAKGGARAALLSGRAFCASKLGRYDEAVRNIQDALKFKPKNNELLFRAAQIYAQAGHREEALAYVQRAVQEGYSREELRRDLTLSILKDDPQFRAIMDSEAR